MPFQFLKVGFFDDVKYLNTTEATDLKEIDDLPCIDLISPENNRRHNRRPLHRCPYQMMCELLSIKREHY